jgi:regulator of sigma D
MSYPICKSKNPNAGTRLPNQTAQRIRRLLLDAVRQGRMQSYEEMKEHLESEGIDRSLSSIYRYIAGIKASFEEFKDRNFSMYKKDAVHDYFHPPKQEAPAQ